MTVSVDRPRRTRGALVLVAMCLGAATTFLQITSAAGALGAMQADLGLTPSQLIWVPSAYTLPVASLILFAGEAGSRFGRRRVFLIGTAVMAAGASIVALSGSFAMVLAGQLITGAGGAMVLPTSLALLGAAFPDARRRAEVITARTRRGEMSSMLVQLLSMPRPPSAFSSMTVVTGGLTST